MELISRNEILKRIGHFTYLRDLGIKQISDEEYDLIDESRDLIFRLRLNDYNEIAVSIELPMTSVVKFDSGLVFNLHRIAMFSIEDGQLKISAYRFKGSDVAFKLIDQLTEFCEEIKQTK